jgi:tRNA (guanine37-N1)-methyltransferase
MHRFTVITLFPEVIAAFGQCGIVRRACEAGIARISTINPRTFSTDARGTVDDSPYGGGPGMVMLARPLRGALAAARANHGPDARVIYLSPQGRPFTQTVAEELTAAPELVLLAGRYEGVDERVVQRDVDEELSMGDFVLSGGEIAAMAVIDAVIRLLPGALGDAGSAAADSFSSGLLDYPHYTRPEDLDGERVPAVLLSGDHAAIAAWRRKQALGRTWLRRPDLLRAASLEARDRALLEEFIREFRDQGTAKA